MGFLDSLKKIVIAAESDDKRINSSASSSVSPKKTEPADFNVPVKKTPQDILDSGNIPAKKSVLFEDEFGDKNYSFSLSGDFIEFNSHCEMMPSFQYEPHSNDNYTVYLENYPQILIGPYDDIYYAVENDSPVGEAYEKLGNKYFAFRTKMVYYGDALYCYAFRDGTAREREMFGLTYSRDIEGTLLEKKLMAALDEAASTYTESEIN